MACHIHYRTRALLLNDAFTVFAQGTAELILSDSDSRIEWSINLPCSSGWNWSS